eukprot:gene350-gene292
MKKKITNCIEADIRYVRKERHRWNTWRLMIIASTTTLRPGSVRTISAAAHAASVAPCTAMPTSARFSAGASFTPSPVMAHVNPFWRSVSTIMNLCSGNTCAKPPTSRIMSPYFSPRSLGSSFGFSSLGRRSAVRMFGSRSSMRHISFAIRTWSPVIIFTSTPYSLLRRIVSFVSGRGGSRKVRIPHRCHRSWASVFATERQRIPREARSSMMSTTSSLIWSELYASSRIMCGAPLVTLNFSFVRLSTSVAAVRFSVGSNGEKSSC